MGNSKYELELIPVKIGGTRIELWTVKRWQDAVERDFENEAQYVDHFPLWIKIWEASIVLCEHLTQMDLAEHASILELGAGVGLAGMMLGARGHSVTLTDYDDDALILLGKNAQHNELKNVRVKKLDWFQADAAEVYDIIIGSELVYKDELIKPLLDVMIKHLKTDGKIVIAHDIIRRNTGSFLKNAERHFQIQHTVKMLNTDGKQHRIAIHSLQLK